jgi:hypothetical protein
MQRRRRRAASYFLIAPSTTLCPRRVRARVGGYSGEFANPLNVQSLAQGCSQLILLLLFESSIIKVFSSQG